MSGRRQLGLGKSSIKGSYIFTRAYERDFMLCKGVPDVRVS